ncbi:MAG: hypothetical protein EAZ89_17420 [Bacteroidetes bacterium]|nr:MAG: hypothetical protein EAZ89_17420 [Bacteroidota bacterium]
MLLVGCQPPQPGAGATGTGTQSPAVNTLVQGLDNVSTELQEMSRPNKVQAWVDELIVKVQPGKDMPQVATMQEGETAEYLYQRTIRRTEFTLRGQRFYEPWILIRTKAGVMGWVHEGGVRFLGNDLNDLLVGKQSNTDPNARTRSTDPKAEVPPSEDRRLLPGRQVGAIRLSTTEEDLIRIYGPENIGRSEVLLPGNQKEGCTVVFPGLNDELRITWKDDSRSKIKAIYLDRGNSSWLTSQGIGVGTPLSELVKANRAPVSFYGFNWEYGGVISSWKSGTMAPYEKKCYAVLAPRKQGTDLSRYAGNQAFTSNAPDLDKLDLAISRICVYLD